MEPLDRAIDRDELLELRDRLWKLGAITIQGCMWLDEILGVDTYQRNRELNRETTA